MPDTLRVYLCGAHSTGKTTIARWIAETYKLPFISEVARAVLAELEMNLGSLRANLGAVSLFQQKVFARQIEAENMAGGRFVSDRSGLDNLAYAASHTTKLASIAAGLPLYVERLRQPGSVIFFVRPHRELCSQDGTREREDWEEIVRIDGMVRLLLELHDLDHVVVASLSMAERARTVRAVLAAHGLKPATT